MIYYSDLLQWKDTEQNQQREGVQGGRQRPCQVEMERQASEANAPGAPGFWRGEGGQRPNPGSCGGCPMT